MVFQKTKSAFSGDLKISVHFLDTAGFYQESVSDFASRAELEKSIKVNVYFLGYISY